MWEAEEVRQLASPHGSDCVQQVGNKHGRLRGSPCQAIEGHQTVKIILSTSLEELPDARWSREDRWGRYCLGLPSPSLWHHPPSRTVLFGTDPGLSSHLATDVCSVLLASRSPCFLWFLPVPCFHNFSWLLRLTSSVPELILLAPTPVLLIQSLMYDTPTRQKQDASRKLAFDNLMKWQMTSVGRWFCHLGRERGKLGLNTMERLYVGY